MASTSVPDDITTIFSELNTLRESMLLKSLDSLETEKLITLLDAANKNIQTYAESENQQSEFKHFSDLTWGLAFAITLNFPSSLSWPVALHLSKILSIVSKEPPSPQPLLGIEAVREATLASDDNKPLIPKAFATLLIAMVTQHYLTVDDLEGHALALLHFDWLKEELLFIEKCLVEIKAILAEKLVAETEIHLMIDWIAETVRAMVADMEP